MTKMPKTPPNSDKSRQRVTTMSAKRVEKKGGIGDIFREVAKYVVVEILVPSAKEMFSTMVSNGVDMALFGESRNRPHRTNSRHAPHRGRTAYSSYSRRPEPPEPAYVHRQRFDEVYLEDRNDAQMVLNELQALIYEYGFVTVSDLYQLVGMTSELEDRRYGWTDLSNARIGRSADGYYIQADEPRNIKH